MHCAVVSRNMELVKYLVSTHPKLLEQRSVDGWTPLLVAACQRKIEAVQILLDAGANPFATDLLERNMLHLLLLSPGEGGWISDPSVIPSFLKAMPRVILKRLLEQRCVENPGGLTPFARWIFTRPEPSMLFTTVLELSNVRVFEILDGAGRTLLHTVCASHLLTLLSYIPQQLIEICSQVINSSMDNLIRPIIEKAPHILFVEGKDGETPVDMVIERHLQELLRGFVSRYLRSRRWPMPCSLIHWPLFAFGTGYNGPAFLRDPYKCWEICREIVNSRKSSQPPRKLITADELDEITQLQVLPSKLT
jgi:hypothetical protein